MVAICTSEQKILCIMALFPSFCFQFVWKICGLEKKQLSQLYLHIVKKNNIMVLKSFAFMFPFPLHWNWVPSHSILPMSERASFLKPGHIMQTVSHPTHFQPQIKAAWSYKMSVSSSMMIYCHNPEGNNHYFLISCKCNNNIVKDKLLRVRDTNTTITYSNDVL